MKVIGHPLDGVTDWMQELGMVFARSAAEPARALARRRRLERQLEELRPARQQAAEQLPALDARLKQLARELEDAKRMGKTSLETAFGAILFIIGVVSLVLFIFVHAIFGLLGTLGLVAFAMWAKKKNKASEEGRARVVAEAGASYDRTAQERFQAATKLQETDDMIARLAQEHESIRPVRTLRAVARAYIPVTCMELAGYPVLIDHGGTTEPTKLRLPDLATHPAVLERVQAALASAARRPVMLQASGQGPSELDTLHGEEARLQTSLAEFSDMLDAIPVYEESISLVPKGAGLHRYVEGHPSAAHEREVPGMVLQSSQRSDQEAAMKRLGDMAARLRKVGRDVGKVIGTLHGELGSALDAYRGLRSEAMRQVHEGFSEVLASSDLPYVTWYCPKCNRVPQYLFHRLGIDIDTAHELSPDDLLQALQRDQETRERLVSDRSILDELSQAWQSAREVQANLEHLEAAQRESASGQVGNLGEMRAFESRLHSLRAQRQQSIAQFRAGLRKAVTGNARPLVELSRQARLFLDPDRNVWTCGACSTVFDDPAVARMGRMLRIKDELLMPMWNHLWTEKDDFRKSELFRTNEQIQRLMEKETGALRDVAEQYRADMRPVRENLILATSEAGTKRKQLETTVKSLTAIGVLSARQAESSVGDLVAMTGGNLDEQRRRAENKETLLNQEPQAQMSRRVPALDPVSLFLTPDSLFRHNQRSEAPIGLRSTAGR